MGHILSSKWDTVWSFYFRHTAWCAWWISHRSAFQAPLLSWWDIPEGAAVDHREWLTINRRNAFAEAKKIWHIPQKSRPKNLIRKHQSVIFPPSHFCLFFLNIISLWGPTNHKSPSWEGDYPQPHPTSSAFIESLIHASPHPYSSCFWGCHLFRERLTLQSNWDDTQNRQERPREIRRKRKRRGKEIEKKKQKNEMNCGWPS